MHSSHTGWSSPTGSHSVIRRRAQRSAGRQLLHTTQSFSGIGMTVACSPKVAHKRPKEGLSMKGVRSMLDPRPTLNRRPSIPSTVSLMASTARKLAAMSSISVQVIAIEGW